MEDIQIEAMEKVDCHCGCDAIVTKANRGGIELTDAELDALNETDLSEEGMSYFH